MVARSSLEALTQAPLALLRSGWPWRSLVYLMASAGPALVVVAVGWVVTVVWAGGPGAGGAGPGATVAGRLGLVAVVIALLVLVTPLITGFERSRLRLVDNEPLPPAPPGWWVTRLRQPESWRDFAYAIMAVAALWWVDIAVVALAIVGPGILLTAPFQPGGTGPVPSALLVLAGLLLIPVAGYPVTAWAGARAAMSRAILNPDEASEVRRSRARLVDAFEVERRRIERDLHDGAQQRLVALTMKLGLAKLDVPPESTVFRHLDDAHAEARAALDDLRELIHGVHPQILAGRGLPAAVRDLAGRSPVPVEVNLPIERLPEAVEVSAYYVVAEALTNVARHSRARQAGVTGRYDGGRLRIEVTDDGVGGAEPERGTGLTGLADRVAAVDGRLFLSSPAGGPTVLRVEIPCSA